MIFFLALNIPGGLGARCPFGLLGLGAEPPISQHG